VPYLAMIGEGMGTGAQKFLKLVKIQYFRGFCRTGDNILYIDEGNICHGSTFAQEMWPCWQRRG